MKTLLTSRSIAGFSYSCSPGFTAGWNGSGLGVAIPNAWLSNATLRTNKKLKSVPTKLKYSMKQNILISTASKFADVKAKR